MMEHFALKTKKRTSLYGKFTKIHDIFLKSKFQTVYMLWYLCVKGKDVLIYFIAQDV